MLFSVLFMFSSGVAQADTASGQALEVARHQLRRGLRALSSPSSCVVNQGADSRLCSSLKKAYFDAVVSWKNSYYFFADHDLVDDRYPPALGGARRLVTFRSMTKGMLKEMESTEAARLKAGMAAVRAGCLDQKSVPVDFEAMFRRAEEGFAGLVQDVMENCEDGGSCELEVDFRTYYPGSDYSHIFAEVDYVLLYRFFQHYAGARELKGMDDIGFYDYTARKVDAQGLPISDTVYFGEFYGTDLKKKDGKNVHGDQEHLRFLIVPNESHPGT